MTKVAHRHSTIEMDRTPKHDSLSVLITELSRESNVMVSSARLAPSKSLICKISQLATHIPQLLSDSLSSKDAEAPQQCLSSVFFSLSTILAVRPPFEIMEEIVKLIAPHHFTVRNIIYSAELAKLISHSLFLLANCLQLFPFLLLDYHNFGYSQTVTYVLTDRPEIEIILNNLSYLDTSLSVIKSKEFAFFDFLLHDLVIEGYQDALEAHFLDTDPKLLSATRTQGNMRFGLNGSLPPSPVRKSRRRPHSL
ncbi:hypothetical protein BLNAU_8462 [Blattamonas nauphoetae]|uniref:Uncharacterized protein n=1 Tax=Blattamonas nauphoetae TaxID=2049346 RepID=A0ABQ9XYQ9_9EUKA|nr:hypothetical protein BLNAU_8462 [Blattamonas nauphoetae]